MSVADGSGPHNSRRPAFGPLHGARRLALGPLHGRARAPAPQVNVRYWLRVRRWHVRADSCWM